MAEFTFETEIYYSQIGLFRYGIENPFNDWNDTHVNQGFSWREGSVSFATLSDEIECQITIKLINDIKIDDDIDRAIIVPFRVEKRGIEVGSIMETVAIDIPEGDYELLFTAEKSNQREHYIFAFKISENPAPRVLKADDTLSFSGELLMEANPAI